VASRDDPPEAPSLEERMGQVLHLAPAPAQARPYLRSLGSAVDVLQNDACGFLAGRTLRWNEMSETVELGGAPLRDTDMVMFRLLCEGRLVQLVKKRAVPLQLGKADVAEAFDLVARNSSYHPVRDYLRSLKWDGGAHLLRLPALAGAEDTDLNRLLFKRWAISAVARPLRPGCKVDTVLVLQGAQGTGKSTFFKTLASPAWFCDALLEIGTDDAAQRLEGVWIYELAELDAIRKSEWSAIRQFVTEAEDKYHVRYDRMHRTRKRDGVIVGTTNPQEFLDDPTGARRFWPVKVLRQIDLAELTRLRDQIWAEAVALYDAGEPWHLAEQEEVALRVGQEEFTNYDEWTGPIAEWVDGRLYKFQMYELFEGALKLQFAQQTQVTKTRVSRVLRSLGYYDYKSNGKKYWKKAGEP
jgi:putative DNA primase/helicase